MKILFTIRQIFESLRFALSSVMVNKMRTFLSLLGITIGIFAIISVFTLIDSMERYMRSNVEAIGSNVIYVGKWPWTPDESGEYKWWKYANRPELSIAEFNEMQRSLPSAQYMALTTGFTRTLKREGQSLDDVHVIGGTHDYDQMRKTDLSAGRYFNPQESEKGAPVAILGATVAEELFQGEDPLGKTFKMGGHRVNIIGVFKKEGENMFGLSYDDQVLIPFSFARNFVNLRWAGIEMVIKSRPEANFEDFKGELGATMRRLRRLSPEVEDNFSLNEVSAISSQLDQMFTAINLVGGIIGIFAILVGGFGVANIMFVSVRERTSQIGIEKALGARSYFILLQFVFEAVLLSVVGGAVGLLLIWIGVLVGSALSGMEIVLTLRNIVIGLGISSVVGAVSGFFPAWSAAKMLPVKAIYKT